MRRSLLGLVVIAPAAIFITLSGRTSAQSPAPVDFARDVQPLLRANCYSCHGETLQSGNFRLDRRRDSLPNRVGANGARIVPGNSGASRLYQRVSGSQGGLQMPPSGAMPPEQIAVLKNWIDQGAAWPDEFDGEQPSPPRDPVANQLLDALRQGDRATVERLLTQSPGAARAAGSGGITPLMHAALYRDMASLRRLLDLGADANAKNDAGATALLWAVDDLEITRLLLDRGADPNVRSVDGRTALLLAAGRAGGSDVVTLLLDRGARMDGQPLLVAAGDAADAATIRLLLDRGADRAALPNDLGLRSGCADCAALFLKVAGKPAMTRALLGMARYGDSAGMDRLLALGAEPSPAVLRAAAASEGLPAAGVAALLARGVRDEQAMDWAARHGATPVVNALRRAGVSRVNVPAPALKKPAASRSVRAAIEASLPRLQHADTVFLKSAGCISCHNNSLFQMTAAALRPKGFRIDEAAVREQMARTRAYLASWRERELQDIAIPGQIDTTSYILAGLVDASYAPDAATDALARFVRRRQYADGSWRIAAHRPPIESSSITTTALAIRSLRSYAPAPLKVEYAQAVTRGASWLATATPKSTEDHAFVLLGLAWARHEDAAAIRRTAAALIAQQRQDGGWSQIPTLASDAYATGQALVALTTSGALNPDGEVYRKGVRFLLDTQLDDGSWYVRSRAIPVQPYFDSEFPHGPDQFISAAATNWATMALAAAAPQVAAATPPSGVEVLPVRDNVFMIAGAGGNIAVQVGDDGVVVVDAGSAASAPDVVAAIRRITPKPIRYIINTGPDADHVGGNETLSKAGQTLFGPARLGGQRQEFMGPAAAIMATEGVLRRMTAPSGSTPAYPAGAWPTESFHYPRKYMYLNGEAIEVLHQPAAHTDGDAFVFFRRSDVVVAGDVLDTRQFPVIDVDRGGSIDGVIAALNRLSEIAVASVPIVAREAGTVVIPGHGRLYDQYDVIEYRDMVTVIRDRVRELVAAGRSLEQVRAANPARGYIGRYGNAGGAWTTDQFVAAVYRSLAKDRK